MDVIMKGKRVFVSGGAGVIGQEMVKKLIDRGAIVFVGDIKPRPNSFPSAISYRQGDLNTLTRSELEMFAPEVFIHLAATFERSIETYEFWDENYIHNIKLSHHLMNIAKDLPSLKKVIFASSYLIYHSNLYLFNHPGEKVISLSESDPVYPRNLIGMAKMAHEIELQFLEKTTTKQLSIVCARIFRGYGRGSRDIISRWIRTLVNGGEITVYRLEGKFDYIYAKDSAEGLIRLAEDNTVSGIINLGSGHSRSIYDVLNILQTHFPEMKIVHEDSDIPYEASQADMTNFNYHMGWLPEYSLEEGISEIITYEKQIKQLSDEVQPKINNILVTSSSKKVPFVNAVKQAAQKINPDIKVICGDIDHNVLTKYIADDFWIMPRISDNEVEGILNECIKRDIRVIIPTRDGELLFWAKNAEIFEQSGIKVIISPQPSIELCLDKYAFSQFGISHGFPFIPSEKNPDILHSDRYVVKERFGAGSKNMGLKVKLDDALKIAQKLENPIFQPFIGGMEISIDAWLDAKYCVKGLVLRTRDQVVGGESQITTTFHDSSIEALAVRILESLQLRGPVVMQAIIDGDGRPHIIECNSRFGGASTISIAAGLDSWYWSLLEVMGENIADYPFNRVSGRTKQIRIPHDIYEYNSHL